MTRLMNSDNGHAAGEIRCVGEDLHSSTSLTRPMIMTDDKGSGDALSSHDIHCSTTSQLLQHVGILDLLQQDDRPTFVIDLADHCHHHTSPLKVAFVNGALKSRPRLLQLVPGLHGDLDRDSSSVPASAKFGLWATRQAGEDSKASDVSITPYFYLDQTWTYSTLRKRLRVIRCQLPSATDRPPPGWAEQNGEAKLSQPSTSSTIPAEEGPTNLSYLTLESVPPITTGPVSSTSPIPSDVFTPKGEEDDSKIGLLSQSSTINTLDTGLFQRSSFSKADLEPSPARIVSTAGAQACAGKSPEKCFLDWTRLPASPATAPHIHFALGTDWAATSLGPMESWDADLRSMCNLLMASPHPTAMYWGPDLITIYNEAYVPIAGSKHPALMGQAFPEAWSEIWDEIQDVFLNALQHGQAAMKDEDRFLINRDGFVEETYFSWSIIPLTGIDSSVVGLYNPAFEKTRRKIADRRLVSLREIGEKTAGARTTAQFWPRLLQGIKSEEGDLPLVLLYSVLPDLDNDASPPGGIGHFSNKTLVLEGSLGVPASHRIAPGQINLSTSTHAFASKLRSAIQSEKPIVMSTMDGTLDTDLLEGLPWRDDSYPSSTIVICPIRPTTAESTYGFLLLGTNPRRPFDEDYELFVELLARQLTTSMASVVLYEKEIQRGQRAAQQAAQDHFELSNQLAARTKEAVESEMKSTWMAELAPVGVFIADAAGHLNYCNSTWYRLSSYPRRGLIGEDWVDCVVDEDKAVVAQQWQKVLNESMSSSIELRFKTPWEDRAGNKLPYTWVLASVHPEKGLNGVINWIFGSITDITTQKFAEELQRRRTDEAVELKRQQENFIDITSHEMRNPLSAILQCADEICSSLIDYRDRLPADLVESNIEAAQTIILCAQHQKRIVDDVLTLSKLDSARLLVTPVDIQPANVVQHALRMFDGEVHNADISLNFDLHPSLQEVGVDWVRLDPSRLLQVLINLTTNAIKFTTAEHKRSISMILGASSCRPSECGEKTVDYVPARNKGQDTTSSPEWGTGEVIYITFAIQDTGRGLTEDEKKLMFHRFSQASPRTHVTYGGSGLGLFISRELVELQGGEIGVSSESGKGSRFAFYVKARRSSGPPKDSKAPVFSILSGRSAPGQDATKADGPSGTTLTGPKKAVTEAWSEVGDSSAVEQPLQVLIVEDNLVNQKVLARQLQKSGCVVEVANHGGEAIERLKMSRFWEGREGSGQGLDVILMDVEMPVMDGLSCMRKIREFQVYGTLRKHVPIIAVTANARDEQVAQTKEAGADDVMAKPFRIPELVPKMKDLVRRHRVKGGCREC